MRTAMSIPSRFGVYEEIGFGTPGPALQHIWSLLENEEGTYEVDFWGIRLAYAYGIFVDAETAIRVS